MSFTVGKLRVLIATTNGPVEIQLLTEEDAAIGRCVACIGGTTETADIASAYHAFVVRPTGVIEGRFGHSCYRLDVSARIDAGSSWQLGVLAAHALLAVGRLAQENDVADGILWVTGSVRPVDLTVGAVSHVPEKFATSLDRLKPELNAGHPVLLAVPAANADEASTSGAKELLELGAKLVVVSNAQALFDALGMKLPGAGSKATSVPPPIPPQGAAPPKRRRGYAWAAVAALVGVVGAGAVVLSRVPRPPALAAQAGGTAAAPTQVQAQLQSPPPAPMPPAPTQVPAPPVQPQAPAPPVQTQVSAPPAQTQVPAPPAQAQVAAPPAHAQVPAQPPSPVPKSEIQPGPRVVELVPETIPFIKTSDRQRIRDEYLPAPNYKALAMNMFEVFFASGLPSQEMADRAAVENCEIGKRRRQIETALTQIEHHCDLFASGTVVVSQRAGIAMPPMPWVNASVQRAFFAADLPMVSEEIKFTVERRYPHGPRSKALVIGPRGRLYATYAENGPQEAMRRSLERCGFVSRTACIVLAVDDTFVTAVPTSARAVGFYRQDALLGVRVEERAEVARRLASSREGWQAVALGATGRTGIKVGASSEQSAIHGAMENCARYDHDCRIAVIGPLLVEGVGMAPAQRAFPPARQTFQQR